MGGTSRMDHQGFHIGHIGKQREYLQVIDESSGLFLPALDLESKDGCASLWKIFLIQAMISAVWQRRMVHPLYLGMLLKIFYYF
ncbi:hypothetical protein SDC9_199311 [bioreactor metagenome]|uniref:Uncharacterized protein n=1 Tax=bioreactor metagenome TaxID=1076179 RepID=A0A645ILE8_9ZZZZ